MELVVEKLNKSFKKQSIFKEANMNIEKPGIYGLVAPNGYGKTTLLNIISGLSKYESGTITIFNQSQKDTPAKDFAFLQSNEVLYPYLTGLDHLEFICTIHGINKTEINEIAQTYGMTEYLKKKVGKYSLGMKQRLLLGMAMIKRPKLLLLDEPLTGLDPTSTVIVREALIKAQEAGATILISSHDLNELDKLTTNIFFIENQQLTFESLNQIEKNHLEIQIGKSSREHFEEMLEGKKITWTVNNHHSYELEIPVEQSSHLLEELMANGIEVLSFTNKAISAESLYTSKYTKSGETV